jgi:hypothetical protein
MKFITYRPCFECGRPARHNHHVVPQALGGTKTVPLCHRCHGLVHDVDFLHLSELQKAARKKNGWRGGRKPFVISPAVALTLKGLSYPEIAEKLGCCMTTARVKLRELGWKSQPTGRPRKKITS